MPRGLKNPIIYLFFILALLVGQIATASEESFPVYECITANVNFWIKVYTQYSTSQGLMHDSDDLSIIYEVLDLLPYDAPGASRINRHRIKIAKSKYEKILAQLARNPKADDPESRRIADLFGRPHSAKPYAQALHNIRCQIGQEDRFQAGLIRSGAYIDQIKAIFKSHGLPEDLAFLPHVESSFNPNAYSKFGAAGMWQFTRSTGKRFMNVGYELDERRDPIQSAHAAAQLLAENYAKLGDWPLAITAYNHGAAGMLNAKSKHGDYPSIFTSYHSRIFKFASRNFYSEFLAARTVAENYHAYFGSLELDRPLPTQAIPLEGYVSFAGICRHFDVDAQELQALNPSLRSPVVNGQKHIPKGYVLKLPASSSAAAESSGFKISLPSSLYSDKQKPSHFYTVQRGDTAGKIAQLHGVSVGDLIAANNLDRRATIYPRQNLRIPHTGVTTADKTAALISAVTPEKTDASEAASEPATLISEETDTAAEFENFPNPVLASVIPLGTRSSTPIMNAQLKFSTSSQSQPSLEIVTADVQFESIEVKDARVGTIRVEVEETLGHYAEWAQLRTSKIRRLNNFAYGQVLHLHQRVKIPLDQTSPESFVESRYEYHKRLQEDFFAVYRIGTLQPYTVRRGDNYWTLCRDQFEIPLWLLKHCNPETDLADLRYNQKLWIPNIEKVSPNDPSEDSDGDPDMEPDDDVDEPLGLHGVSLGVLALKNDSIQVSP
jgi:membrane-bound lytic murein transglycosylase D